MPVSIRSAHLQLLKRLGGHVLSRMCAAEPDVHSPFGQGAAAAAAAEEAATKTFHRPARKPAQQSAADKQVLHILKKWLRVSYRRSLMIPQRRDPVLCSCCLHRASTSLPLPRQGPQRTEQASALGRLASIQLWCCCSWCPQCSRWSSTRGSGCAVGVKSWSDAEASAHLVAALSPPTRCSVCNTVYFIF